MQNTSLKEKERKKMKLTYTPNIYSNLWKPWMKMLSWKQPEKKDTLHTEEQRIKADFCRKSVSQKTMEWQI